MEPASPVNSRRCRLLALRDTQRRPELTSAFEANRTSADVRPSPPRSWMTQSRHAELTSTCPLS